MMLGTFRQVPTQTKSIQNVGKCYYFMKMMLCFSAIENNTKRNDSRSRKHEESMSVTPKEHLQPVNDTQVGKAQKCQLLYS